MQAPSWYKPAESLVTVQSLVRASSSALAGGRPRTPRLSSIHYTWAARYPSPPRYPLSPRIPYVSLGTLCLLGYPMSPRVPYVSLGTLCLLGYPLSPWVPYVSLGTLCTLGSPIQKHLQKSIWHDAPPSPSVVMTMTMLCGAPDHLAEPSGGTHSPFIMGSSFHTPRPPTEVNWPRAVSRKKSGIPANTSVRKYGIRKAPVT